MPTCYRHPARETAVACSNCARPICTDCMTSTAVGMRCPECSKERTRVYTARSLNVGHGVIVTQSIIAICVVAFLAGGDIGVGGRSGGGWLYENGALNGYLVQDGDVWRLVTGGFLHADLLHIGFNMLLLWFLGSEIEKGIGPGRFAGVYLAALLGGSFGALVQTDGWTVGASGAVFGLMGYALVEMRRNGIGIFQSQIGFLVLFNIALSFRPGVSWGGHLGGLVFGAAAAFLLHEAGRRGPRWAGPAALAALCVVGLVGALVVAGDPRLADGA